MNNHTVISRKYDLSSEPCQKSQTVETGPICAQMAYLLVPPGQKKCKNIFKMA